MAPPVVSRRAALAPAPPRATANALPPPGLTHREREVLGLLGAGLSYNEIAGARLALSFHAAHAHLRTIYGKLGVTSRAQAVRVAGEQRLVSAQIDSRKCVQCVYRSHGRRAASRSS